MWAHISRFILRYKLFLLIFLLFATIFMANKAMQVQYSYEFLPLLPEDDPIYVEYQEFLGHFGQEGNVMVVGFQCDSLYQLENYNAFYDLYGQLKEIEGVEQVVSILQARNMKKNEALKSFEFKPVTSQRYETQEEVDAVAKELASLPFYRKLFYNDKNKTHLMALTLNKQLLDNESRIDLILSIEDVVNPFAEQIGVDVHYSGLPYIRTKSTVKTMLG